MHGKATRGQTGRAVEKAHPAGGFRHVGGVRRLGFGSSCDDADPQRLSEEQPIPGLGTALGPEVGAASHAEDSHAEERLWALNCMATSDDAARFLDLVGAAADDLCDYFLRQAIGEDGEVEGEEDIATHGVHVACGIGCGDGAVGIGIVDDGSEEIGGKDQCALFIEGENGCIVGLVQADEDLWVFFGGE